MNHTQRIDGNDVTLSEQIRCAARELRLRKGVYPKLAGGITAERGWELRAMEAVLNTLESLREPEEIQEKSRWAPKRPGTHGPGDQD